jgi:hypothetical protein
MAVHAKDGGIGVKTNIKVSEQGFAMGSSAAISRRVLDDFDPYCRIHHGNNMVERFLSSNMAAYSLEEWIL